MTRIMGYVLEHFRIPPEAPKPVQDASDAFEKATAEFASAQAEMYSLTASHKDDIAVANRAAAEARVSGGKPPKETPATVNARLDKAKADAEIAEATLDVAGDLLVAAVQEHKNGEWRDALAEAQAEQEQRWRESLDELKACAARLGEIRSAGEWLDGFSALQVTMGNCTQYPGGRAVLIPDSRYVLNTESVTTLFDLLREVSDPPLVHAGWRQGVPVFNDHKGNRVFEDGTPVPDDDAAALAANAEMLA